MKKIVDPYPKKQLAFSDAHIHISIQNDVQNKDFGWLPSPYCFTDFIKDKDLYRIKNAVVFLNPFRKDLYLCGEGHFQAVRENSDGTIQFICMTCGKMLYSGKDPYIADNEELLRKAQNMEGVYPFIYLPIAPSILKSSVEYYETNHKRKFYGWKIHPNLCQVREYQIESTRPIIVHTGVNEYDSPMNAIRFAENYKGKVCLAHCARLNVEALKLAGKMDNVFIDISPTYFLEQVSLGESKKVFQPENFIGKTVAELLDLMINLIGEDKIIFGSDVPFGDFMNVEDLVSSFKASDKVVQKVMSDNFLSFIG